MNNKKFEIHNIPGILREIGYLTSESKADCAIIFITTLDYTYDVSDIPILCLSFYDTYEGQPGFISLSDVKKLQDFLPEIIRKHRVYIGCDKGENRSPAVALALAYHLNLPDDIQYILSTYHFYNESIYEYVKKHLHPLDHCQEDSSLGDGQ